MNVKIILKSKDNKTFLKTVNLFFFSEKTVSTEKITLIDSDIIISYDHDEKVRVLYTFFSNIVPSLNINESIIKSIMKYRSHPMILAIGKIYNRTKKSSFSFSDTKKKCYSR